MQTVLVDENISRNYWKKKAVEIFAITILKRKRPQKFDWMTSVKLSIQTKADSVTVIDVSRVWSLLERKANVRNVSFLWH